MASVVSIPTPIAVNPISQIQQIANNMETLRRSAAQRQLAQQQAQLIPSQLAVNNARRQLLEQQASVATQTPLERNLRFLEQWRNQHAASPLGVASPSRVPSSALGESPQIPPSAISSSGEINPGALEENLIRKSMGLPTSLQEALQRQQLITAQRKQFPEALQLANAANDTTLSMPQRQAAAAGYAKAVLPQDDQAILSGAENYTQQYNKSVAPFAQKFIDEMNTQGIWAKGKLNAAKLSSLLGYNSQLYRDYNTLISGLTDLANSFRRAGGDRATLQQVVQNRDLLIKEVERGDILGAVQTLNYLSKLAKIKSDSIIDNKLGGIKGIYKRSPNPIELKLPPHYRKSGKVSLIIPNSGGQRGYYARANKPELVAAGWKEL